MSADRLQRGSAAERARSSTRNFWPSLSAPSSRAPSARGDGLDLVGRGAEIFHDRVETVSPFFTVMTLLVKLLPPVDCSAVFGSSVMFSGTMRASKPA